jgi:hypothetical protein
MGLLRNGPQDTKKPAGLSGGFEFRSRCEFDAGNRKKAIPGSLRNPSPPLPPCVPGDPLPVAPPDRSARRVII